MQCLLVEVACQLVATRQVLGEAEFGKVDALAARILWFRTPALRERS